MTLVEAEQWIQAFRVAYPGVAAWQDQMRQAQPTVLRAPSGRIRRFEGGQEDTNARLATLPQLIVADCLKLAMIYAFRPLKEIGARLVLCIHDELLAEAPADVTEPTKDMLEHAMLQAMTQYITAVPARVDADVRVSWADPIPQVNNR